MASAPPRVRGCAATLGCGVQPLRGSEADAQIGGSVVRPASTPGTRRAPRPRRGGASIIEVLFSMGIVAVGLLGVLTILPVAGSRVTRGTVADSADRLGRSALRQFEVLQMGRYKWDPGNSRWDWDMLAQWDRTNNTYVPYPGTLATYDPRVDSFCIDPVFITRRLAATDPADQWEPSASYAYCGEFPYWNKSSNASQRLAMARVNLRKHPGAIRSAATEAWGMGDDRHPYPSGGEGFNTRRADDIFLAQDDLAFDLPSDRTLPPLQNFGGNQKRQSEGNFSWLAIVTPSGGAADQCLLSIVVFHRRVPDKTGEKVLRVAEFGDSGYQVSDGMEGGEVTLETLDATQPEEDLKMKPGEWIMLAGKYTANPNWRLFRWYRIQSAEREPRQVSGKWQRDLTLQGQDWYVNLMATLPGQTAGGPWPDNTATIAVWIPGTVAVYEKTFRRESNSLWTEF